MSIFAISLFAKILKFGPAGEIKCMQIRENKSKNWNDSSENAQYMCQFDNT